MTQRQPVQAIRQEIRAHLTQPLMIGVIKGINTIKGTVNVQILGSNAWVYDVETVDQILMGELTLNDECLVGFTSIGTPYLLATLDTGARLGLTITDGFFNLKSSTSGERIEIDKKGVRLYDSSEVNTVELKYDGTFTLKSGATGARIEITSSAIQGYDSGGTLQAEFRASDGQIRAAAGGVRLTNAGVEVYGKKAMFYTSAGANESFIEQTGSYLQFQSPNSFRWFDGANEVMVLALAPTYTTLSVKGLIPYVMADTTGAWSIVYWYEGGAARYQMTYSTEANYFGLASYNIGGGSSGWVFLVLDGSSDVLGNTSFIDNAFDEWCPLCGWHAEVATPDKTCPKCGAQTEEHDDGALLSSAINVPGKVWQMPKETLRNLEKLNVINTFGTVDKPQPQVFLNLQTSFWFLGSAVAQLWRRLTELENHVNQQRSI